MKQSRKIISIVLVLMMCLSLLVSCAPKAGNNDQTPPTSQSPDDIQTPPSGDVKYAEELDIILDNNKIAVLDPFNTAGGKPSNAWVLIMAHNTLVFSRGDGVYGPALATSWETDDWKTITFHLRDDVYFHNGEKFTAEDVAFTITKAQEGVGSLANTRWADIETVTIVDPTTITFTLKDINVDFLFSISQAQASIVNKKAMEDDPEFGVWIGTGPWIITDFSTNDYVKLERNDNYWGEKAITKRITLRYVPETSARLMQLQNGEADVCFAIDPSDLPLLEADTENFVVYNTVYNSTHMLGFNMEDPICGDYNFRMAVASALNKEEITLAACGDYGIAETEGTYYGYATEFRNHDIPMVPFDLEKAKEYLAKSPYKGETIELSVTTIPENVTAAAVVQQQLAKADITVAINQLDQPSLNAYTKYGANESQMIIDVGAFTMGSGSLRNTSYPGAAFNKVSYNNPEVTALLDQVRSVADPNERKEMFMQIQEIVAQDPPRFTMFYLKCAVACVKGVDGMILSNDSTRFDLSGIYKIID